MSLRKTIAIAVVALCVFFLALAILGRYIDLQVPILEDISSALWEGIDDVAQSLGLAPLDIDALQEEIFAQINEERIERGLPALHTDDEPSRIAKEWSEELLDLDEPTHGNFKERISSIRYDIKYCCGEILAHYSGPESDLATKFVNMWLESPEHEAVMLTNMDGFMGVGVATDGEGFYAVVDFAFICG